MRTTIVASRLFIRSKASEEESNSRFDFPHTSGWRKVNKKALRGGGDGEETFVALVL